MSHSPRFAAASPPVLPTFRRLVAKPSLAQPAEQQVQADAVAADHDQVGRLASAARSAATATARRRPRPVLDHAGDGDEPVGLGEGS